LAAEVLPCQAMTLSAIGGAIASRTAHPPMNHFAWGLGDSGKLPGKAWSEGICSLESTIFVTSKPCGIISLTYQEVECMSVFHPCPSLTAGLGTEQRFPAFCRDLWSQNAKSTVLHLRWGTLIPKGWNNSSHQP
jgi:hypothetical protein